MPDNNQKDLNRSNSTTSETKENESESSQKQEDSDTPMKPAEDSGGSDSEKPKSKAQIAKVEDTTDAIRIKCRSMLKQALEVAGRFSCFL